MTATHVPANQVGEIQLRSDVLSFPFRADPNGDVSLDMVLPSDVELGDHVVKICWDGSCHKDAALRVVSGLAEASPTAVANSSPSPSSAPTAGRSPGPSQTPRSTPTAG